MIMIKPVRSSQKIWLVRIDAPNAAGFYGIFSKEVWPDLKRESLSSALKLLQRGLKPTIVFLEGHPGKSLQNAMAQINELQPALPIFVISQWQNASEMRSWFSRFFLEMTRSGQPEQTEKSNAYRLSIRELEILRLMVKGLIKKEIAEQLSISYHTVDNHERNIFRKMNIHTRSGVVAKALIEKIC
jgi:DNA-binding CsgD family transcriptional regulator